MNIVRKFVASGPSDSSQSANANCDLSLSLQHLKKLLAEFKHPPATATVESQEKKFYNMLPLFCKVFDDPSNLKSVNQIFPEALLFCSHASKLMVNEISRKARNQNTVSASLAICTLLQPTIDDNALSGNGGPVPERNLGGHGSVLLRSLCLLASAGPQLVDCMSASSLPSTLVKCIYLFYDLPSLDASLEDDTTARKCRQDFENSFSSLLITVLSTSPSTAEELARKTDLMLLITAASSYCPPHNAHWHKAAIQAVNCVAKFGLKPTVVSFMHSKGAISLWVENLRQIGPPPSTSSSLMDYVDMVLALVTFVQESTNFTTVFLEDFRQSDGYGLVSRTIFAIETMTPISDSCLQFMRNLLLAASLQLATSGPISEPLPPIPTPCSTVHIIPGFAPPSHRDSSASNCLTVRYVAPLSLLSSVFTGAKTDAVCLLVLDVINNLLQQDMNNYFWLEQESLLPDILSKLSCRGSSVQNVFFQIIEHIVTYLNYVPVKELNSIAMIFKQPGLSLECRTSIVACLTRLAAYSAAFADAYRDMGIIELAVVELQRLAPNAKLYAAAHDISDSSNDLSSNSSDEFLLLASILDLLTLLVATSSKNADVVREAEGTKVVLRLVAEEPALRLKSLMLLQSQILASGGEEELTQLLLLAQTCSLVDLDLKSQIFKVVVSILRQNHRCRSMFRRIAGFVYTVSILVQLEGSLACEPKEPWKQVKRTDILVLIRLIFSTLTIVMRYEPANARHFAIEVKYANLAKAVRRLGCFPGTTASDQQKSEQNSLSVFVDACDPVLVHNPESKNCDVFSALFHSLPELPVVPIIIPKELYSACLLFRFLLDMACDLLDRLNVVRSGLPSPRPNAQTTMPSPLSIDIVEIDPQTFGSLSIVHPGAISAMIHLVPDVSSASYPQAAYDLQWFLVSRLSDLMVGMRNQQVMAEAGLAAEILTACPLPLADERHFLHRPLVTIFERTAAHWLSTNDLRMYLRLGSPLNCLPPSEKNKLTLKAVPLVIPLERVKSLVSINTHRPTPPAVELDMRYEGFGCLFLPSIAPIMSTAKLNDSSSPGSHSPNTSVTLSPANRSIGSGRTSGVPTVVPSGVEARLLGGVGNGERGYPPASALSYSCWFCVDQFSVSTSSDRTSITALNQGTVGSGESSHPIFLLLLSKQDGAKEDSSDVSVNLAIFLTTGAADRSLIVVTQEQQLTSLVECFETTPELSASVSSVARFPLAALAPNSPDAVGRWHHVVVTLGRPSTVLRYNNNLVVYLNGRQIGATKTSFVSSTPSFAANVANIVCAYIGTPPLLRRRSSLRWRLGPALLAEELMSANTVASIYNLGPTYTGSYQAVRIDAKAGSSNAAAPASQPLVSEERIIFVLHPSLMSSMTVAKIRKVFSKEDGRLVARQLQPPRSDPDDGDHGLNSLLFGMPSHENATPVRIIHNAAVHLQGPARSLGAVLVGYLGVRTFAPRPCSTVLESIGGARVLLGLVANAESETHLYAAMKALVTALRCNRRLSTHMRLIGGYQLLSLLLRRKQTFLSGHILQLVLSYAGVVQLGPSPALNSSLNLSSFDSSAGLNRPAFRHLVCDLRIWQAMPCDIQQLLYEQLIELVTSSSSTLVPFLCPTEQRSPILKVMFEAELPARLFSRLRDPSLSITNAHTVLTLLQFLFCDQSVLLQFGQFLVWLLPPAAVVDESLINLDNSIPSPNAWQPGQRAVMLSASSLEANVYVIQLRNLCLRSLNRLLFQQGSAASTTEQQNLNKGFLDALFATLGSDWLMLFLQSHLHPSTVLAACNLIFAMLADVSMLQKFREIPSSCGGGWLTQADVVIRARMGQLPGISVSSQSGVPSSPMGPSASITVTNTAATGNTDLLSKEQLKTEICKQAGFSYIYWLLPSHANLPQVWFYLMGLFLGQPYRQPPSHARFDNDAILDWALGSRSHLTLQLKIDVCPEAGIILLSLARNILSLGSAAIPPVVDYPQNLLHFLHYLYRNQQSMAPVITSHPFIAGMIALLFPTSQLPRQFASNSPIRTVAFDLFKSIYMNSLTCSPFSTGVGAAGTSTSITHSVASRTTSILGGVAGTIGATVSVASGSATSSSNAAKDPPTPAPLLDAFLTTCLPEDVSKSAVSAYRTELLSLLANSITAADVLANDKAVLSLMGNSYGNISANVFAFATRIVDVLWSGSYTRSSQEIYEYLAALLQQAKRKGSLPLETLYRPINRTLLYQLSRPLHTALALSSVIRTLQTIHAHQALIFGPDNVDPEFVACLTFCLLAFTGSDFPRAVNELDLEAATTERNETVLSTQEIEASKSAMSSAARRVWEHVYLLRKDQLEEATRTALSTGGSVGLSHDIETFRGIVTDPATRVWNAYLEEEKRRVTILFGSATLPQSSLISPTANSSSLGSVAQTITGTGTAAGAVIHRGLTRMSSKVAGFTTGLLSRSKANDLSSGSSAMLNLVSCPSITGLTISYADVSAWTQYHISIMSELVNWRWQSASEDNRIEDRRLLETWSDLERSLLAFPGLWGPSAESTLLKCQLSMAEGPMRMRKLMLPNLQFYEDYPLRNRPTLVSSTDDAFVAPVPRRGGKLRLPHSLDSEAWDRESAYRFDTLFQSSSGDTQLSSSSRFTGTSTLASLKTGGTSSMTTESPLVTVEGGESEELGGNEQQSATTPVEPGASLGASSGMDDRMTGVASSKLLRGFLEDGDQVQHIYRCARVQGLDSIEGLLLFGSEHLYILDGFTLLKSKEIVEISRLPADLHRPIVPTTCYASGSCPAPPSSISSSAVPQLRQEHAKLRYSTIREVLKRRYLLQPIAIEVFSSDGRTILLAFPHTQTRRAVFSRLMSVAQALLDSAEQSVAGQRAGAHVETSSNPLSALISDRSVTDRWVRNEISNFQYLVHLNTLAARSYNDLMQYPVFPWIVADYDSEVLDMSSAETFRDLSKPMGGQTVERVKQFERRYREWEDSTGESGPYHFGTHYSSAMIVASYLVRMEPFTQIFLRLQGGCFDLPDRMFHSVKEQWTSASRNNMTDVKELIPEFFYLPEFLLNSNRFDFGTKQNGTLLDDAILPPWAHGSPREFVRIHRAALESDYVSAHLNEWIDLIFGYKQYGPDAVEALNVFHPYFYKGAVDIDSITDPVKRNATIGFINNFGQMPKQLFKRPHPTKRLSSEALLANSRLVFHHVSTLQPAKNPMRELKLAVGQLVVNDRSQVLAVEQNKSLIPPTYTQYVAWGFADMSVRLGSYESDKTIAVYESLDSQMVLCALCPSPGLLLTAGKSSLINVWRLDTVRPTTPARLHSQLVGHSDAITCLSASPAYRILLSGSRNGVAIQWDLNGLCFIRELCRLSAPISALATNELTGDIAVCATTELHLFSINGIPLCAVNACPQENQQVLCVAFSQMNEWDDANVILTGGSDGVVRIWSLQYMQVPAESPSTPGTRNPADGEFNQLQPNRQPGAISVTDSHLLIGGEAEPLLMTNDEAVIAEVAENEFTEGSVDIPPLDATVENNTATDELSIPNTGVEFGTTLSQSSTPSSTSLASNSTPIQNINRLSSSQGSSQLVWRYQIVFRGKLTAHTAFARNDNRQPAAVTALTLSRDHRTVFVGDARGRLLSWSVPDKPGATAADHWVRDASEARCQRCKTKFSVVERKHHCRDCGRLVCSSCSPNVADVVRIKAPRPVRVCIDCYAKLNTNTSSNGGTNSSDPPSTAPPQQLTDTGAATNAP